MSTTLAKPAEVERKWYILDAAGKPLGRLPYGATKYSLMGLSVVIDDDCMAKKKDVTVDGGDAVKYLILQPDCKLYSQWDDPASLIF